MSLQRNGCIGSTPLLADHRQFRYGTMSRMIWNETILLLHDGEGTGTKSSRPADVSVPVKQNTARQLHSPGVGVVVARHLLVVHTGICWGRLARTGIWRRISYLPMPGATQRTKQIVDSNNSRLSPRLLLLLYCGCDRRRNGSPVAPAARVSHVYALNEQRDHFVNTSLHSILAFKHDALYLRMGH